MKEERVVSYTFTGEELREAKECGLTFFDMEAEAYQKLGDPDKATLYRALGLIDRTAGLSAVLDTGLLNEYVEYYVAVALRQARIPEKEQELVMIRLRRLFDDFTSQEAKSLYFNGR